MNKRAAESTYRPKGYGISPSLARARAPFRTQNAITGVVLATFGFSVWAYSIYAVKQENFDDVDFEALNTTVEEKAKRISLEDEAKAKQKGVKAKAHEVESRTSGTSSVTPSTETLPTNLTSVTKAPDQRGLLRLLPFSSKLYGPGDTSLIPNAPSVDQIGRLSDQAGRT